MRKIAILIASILLLNSCSTMYYQLYKVDTTSNNHQSSDVVESFSTNECTFSYNFWSKGGSTSFIVTNDTDKQITVNVDECYLVHNGLMTYYFRDRIFSNSFRVGTAITNGSSLAASATKSIGASVGVWNTLYDVPVALSAGASRTGTATSMTSSTAQASAEAATYTKEQRNLIATCINNN